MRILFLSLTATDFHAGTPLLQPLGGTQSAACYLAAALARQGAETFILSQTSTPGTYHGVQCLRWDLSLNVLRQLKPDVVVVLRNAGDGAALRAALPAHVPLVFWAQDDHLQDTVLALGNPAERDAYNGYAMVSRWQLEAYAKQYGIDPSRMVIMRNAIAPCFEKLFGAGETILARKTAPILAYTSTPFRGLDVLLELFPAIRARVPGALLRVFSSMKVYQTPAQNDEKSYGDLYRRSRETAGVEYVGSLAQPELAGALRGVRVLAYPNTFAETSCISVMEAMAAGCRVVTSDFAALPETGAGFMELVSLVGGLEAYKGRFVEAVVAALGRGGVDEEDFLRRQVGQMNGSGSWDFRAGEWTRWLAWLCGA